MADFEAGSSGSHGPPKKKPQSDVWEHYKLVEGQKKVLCMLCNPRKEISYHGGTGNLRDHLTSQDSSVHKSDKANQTSLLEFIKRFCCSEARTKEITDLIVNMVILDIATIACS